MPRIRHIKPEFFTSEDVSALPLRARLTWIGLWTHCDDHGRTKDQVRLIKAAVWPLDDVSLRDVAEDLATLADHGRIVRYEVSDARYLAVQNWHFHQSINRTSRARFPAPPAPIQAPEPGEPGHCALCWDLYSRYPPPPAGNGLTESPVNAHGALTPGTGDRGQGTGEGDRAPAREPPTPRRPRCKRHTHLPEDDPGPPCVACRDARINAEQAAKPALVPVPDWCGDCDPNTRQLELEDGRVARCPRCHPLRSVS